MHNHTKLAVKTILGFCILFSADCAVVPTTTNQATTGGSGFSQISQPFKVKEFVGQVAGTNALIAFAVDGSKVMAYMAGGEISGQNYTSWFSGTIRDNFFSLTSDDNRVLTGKFSDANAALSSSAQGKVSIGDGTIFSWTANVARTNSPAGLYRKEDSNMLLGAIVNNDLRIQGGVFRKLEQGRQDFFQLKLIEGLREGRCLQVGYNTGPGLLQTLNLSPFGENNAACTPSGNLLTSPASIIPFTPAPTVTPVITSFPTARPTTVPTFTPTPFPTATATPVPTPVPTANLILNALVTNMAGVQQSTGNDDANGTDARFNSPRGLAVDNSGNVYVADTANFHVRKITRGRDVSTYSASSSSSTPIEFINPNGIAVDSNGNIFVADKTTIKRIGTGGEVTTFFNRDNSNFKAITIDNNNNLYVINSLRIEKITPGGNNTIIAGSIDAVSGFADGNGISARFAEPRGITVDRTGQFVYISDSNNNRIRKIDLTSNFNNVTTIAGNGDFKFQDGAGTQAQFNGPGGIVADAAGNLYVADLGNRRIRRIDINGFVSTIAGNGDLTSADGTGTLATFTNPEGIAIDSTGNLYIADGNMIRKIVIR